MRRTPRFSRPPPASGSPSTVHWKSAKLARRRLAARSSLARPPAVPFPQRTMPCATPAVPGNATRVRLNRTESPSIVTRPAASVTRAAGSEIETARRLMSATMPTESGCDTRRRARSKPIPENRRSRTVPLSVRSRSTKVPLDSITPCRSTRGRGPGGPRGGSRSLKRCSMLVWPSAPSSSTTVGPSSSTRDATKRRRNRSVRA